MREECRMEKMFFVAGLAAVAASATLSAAVVESTDPDTGYKVLTVEAGEFAQYATVLDASVPGLIKRGAGTAWLTGANSAFVGPIQIEAGVLGGKSGAFGKTGDLHVLSNATLDVSYQPSKGMATRKLYFEGDGAAGTGAIICTNTAVNYDDMFKDVEMTGDGSWGGTRRYGMRYGTFTMNGHTVTKVGSGTLSIFESVASPGNIVAKSGQVLAQSGAQLNGDSSNKFVADGGYINMWCLNYSTEKINWTYVAKGSARLDAGGLHSSRTGYNQYAGPISIEGSQLKILMASSTPDLRKLSITGPITTAPGAAGKLYKTGGGAGGATWIMNTAQLGSVTLDAGELHFMDAPLVTVSNAYTYVNGTTSTNVPTMTLTNTTWIAHPQPSDRYGKERNPNQIMAGNGANKWGLVKIYNDTTVTNDITVGYDGGVGAIHQSGARSKVYTRATTSNDGYIGHGNGGYGYWGLTDGTVEVYAHTTVALSPNSVGFIVQHGGLFKMLTSSWKFSKGGHAELYVTDGGTFDGGTTFTFGSQDYSTTQGGMAVITSDGEGSLIKLAGTYFQWRTNFWSQVNVRNGGTVQLLNLASRGVGLAQAGLSEAYVSFDGGTVRLTSTAGNIFGSATAHDKDPTAVVVYSGGATIETEAANAVWTAPLVRPTGQSITSITLPADVLSPISYKKMIGPPRIVIGGNGHGATAIADYDDATRTVKGVIVTSPGYGYDGETTVTVDSWDRKSALPCTYTLGEVAGGGFTKKGAGKLTLGGANTYAGATRLEGGTLAFADPNGYPGGDLEIAAAAVQGALAAPLLTANTLAFAEGKGVRVTEADTLDDATFGAMKTVATFTNPIGLPSLTLVNADETTWASNRQWRLMLVDGGRTLKFGPLRGTQILLK